MKTAEEWMQMDITTPWPPDFRKQIRAIQADALRWAADAVKNEEAIEGFSRGLSAEIIRARADDIEKEGR